MDLETDQDREKEEQQRQLKKAEMDRLELIIQEAGEWL